MIPQTIPMREILRNWRAVFAKTKKAKEPLIILSNNEPQAALISLDLLEEFRLEKLKLEALTEYRQGKTKAISTSEEFEKEIEEIRQNSQSA